MKLQIKYNKTTLREFQKRLQVRERALPTLKNKEASFRAMVVETKKELELNQAAYQRHLEKITGWKQLWQEYDKGLLGIKKLHYKKIKIAGIILPQFEKIEFETIVYNFFSNPPWFSEGTSTLKSLAEKRCIGELLKIRLAILEQARKKATQKVNLYEKLQIPALLLAIKQIKQYLEDEENLAKSSQKLLKTKLEKLNCHD